jgi:site-specific DNA-methyltransferase (adenine-specific)
MAWTIHDGDCLHVMRGMADNSVDAIVTDPPYFKVKGDAWDRQWDKPTQFLAWLDTIAEQWARLLKPNGSLYCFASSKMAARVECLIASRFSVLSHIVWQKGDANGNGMHTRQHKEGCRIWFPQTERIIFAEHYGSDNIAKGEAGYVNKCDELRGFVFEPLRAYLDSERQRACVTPRQVNEAARHDGAHHPSQYAARRGGAGLLRWLWGDGRGVPFFRPPVCRDRKRPGLRRQGTPPAPGCLETSRQTLLRKLAFSRAKTHSKKSDSSP